MSGLEDPLLGQDKSNRGFDLDADVLIVGAGPVGLLMAVELTQRKVKVHIIDRWPKQEIKTKAVGVAKTSMQVLPTPVVEQIEQGACKPKGIRIREVVGNVSTEIMKLQGMDVPANNEYVPLQCIEQWKTEKFLEDHLRSLGVEVERPMTLKDFSQKSDYVECDMASDVADIFGNKATKKMNVGFLVGCDGGSSFVRKKLGFEFQGEVANETFVSGHAYFKNQAGEKDWVDVWLGKNVSGGNILTSGFCISLPLHDGEHLINLDLDEAQQEKYLLDAVDSHGLRKLKELTEQDILDQFRNRSNCQEMTMENVTWIAHYRVNSRLSEQFGCGRVYLAGDACHCHSPVGGQGMNMGIQDAKNLAWKLASVIKKTNQHSLLLSYEVERRGIDAKVTKSVEMATKAVSARNPLIFFLRGRSPRVIGATLNFVPEVAKSTRGYSYDNSTLCHEHWERPSVLATFKDVLRNPTVLCNPTRVYRRRQNVHRWSAAWGARTAAGDSVPPVLVNGMNLYDFIKSSPGWTLLFFEGDAGANNEMSKNGLPVLSFAELQALGEELKQKPDKDGYVGLIDKTFVFASSDLKAHATFGILGQCLFLIRPDTYVGLRSEPVRKGAVSRYFTSIGGIDVPAHRCPPGASSFDPLPATFLLVDLILLVIGGWLLANHMSAS